MQRASAHDRNLIIPLILAVVLIILALLLRALVAPLVLTATVVLSFAAALGVSAFFFTPRVRFRRRRHLLPAVRVRVPGRAGHRLQHLPDDPGPRRSPQARRPARRARRARRDRRGDHLAGFVLAGTFAVLATIPATFLTELGFAVAFGILLDTIIVRSVLVTALNLDLGRWMWWPSKLAHKPDPAPAELSQERATALTAG